MPALSATALALVKARQQAGESQATIARLIGISPSSLSLLLRGSYPARDLDGMERRIVAALGQVRCPYLGRTLPAPDCIAYRTRTIPTSDPKAMRFWRACQTCPTGLALTGRALKGV